MIAERKIITSLLSIYLLLFGSRLSAQNQAPYFEQNGNNIFIEAEDGGGYGWLKISASNASGGSVFLCPITDTLRFLASADTYIDVHNPETNYGSSVRLLVDGKGGRKRGYFWTDFGGEAYEKVSYIKFEVTGVTGFIIQARVYLYCEESGYGGGMFVLDPLRDDLNWNEYEATWNNRPSKGATAGTFQYYMGEVQAGNWYAFDVTHALYKKGNGIYSFGLAMQENQPTAWSSREGGHPPYLEVEVPRLFSVSGNVLYYANNDPIRGVTLLISGAYSVAETTGSSIVLNKTKHLIQNLYFTHRKALPADRQKYLH